MPEKIQVTMYRCRKCGSTGHDESEVADHEKRRITGRNNRLDGLVVLANNSVLVFKEVGLNKEHKVTYAWDNYDRKLNTPEQNLREDVIKAARALVGPINFTSDFILDRFHFEGMSPVNEGTLLCTPDNMQPCYTRSLTLETFLEISRRLKKKYPDKYAQTEFKRTYK